MALSELSAATSVSACVEVERQWRAHASLRLPAAIGDWRLVDALEERLVDHYYDTTDLELHAQRVRLRVRRSDSAVIWSSASSARFRSVTSMTTPGNRTALPASSRSTCPRAFTHRHPPAPSVTR